MTPRSSKRKRKHGDDLASIRKEMEELVESILDLAKARQELAIKVAEVKKKSGLSVEDLQAESNLLKAVDEYAKRIGLDRGLAADIAQRLIDSSKKAQRKQIHVEEIRSFLRSESIKKVAIVGAGRMGGWFAKYFAPLVEEVTLFDSDSETAKKRAREIGCAFVGELSELSGHDLFIVSVPISKTHEVIDEILSSVGGKQRDGKMRENSLRRVIEVSSVKRPKSIPAFQPSISGKKKDNAFSLISIHPMFGSSADPYARNSMIFVMKEEEEGRGIEQKNSELSFITHVFPHIDISAMDAKTHDEFMSLILSLPHSLALIFALILGARSSRRKIPIDLRAPSFDALHELAKSVLSESPKIYFEIQSQNEDSSVVLTEISRRALELAEIMTAKDGEGKFEKLFSYSQGALRTAKSDNQKQSYNG